MVRALLARVPNTKTLSFAHPPHSLTSPPSLPYPPHLGVLFRAIPLPSFEDSARRQRERQKPLSWQNGGILSFLEGKKRYSVRRFPTFASSYNSKKSAPLRSRSGAERPSILHVNIIIITITQRKKAFFFSSFSLVTDVTKRTNRKIDMIRERTASTHFLRRLHFFSPALPTAGPGKGWAADKGLGRMHTA